MNNSLTKKERNHLSLIKSMPCGVCGNPPPSEAHHVRQHMQWTCIPLCIDCHRGSLLGIHGQKRAWTLRKVDELDVLNNTIREIIDNAQN